MIAIVLALLFIVFSFSLFFSSVKGAMDKSAGKNSDGVSAKVVKLTPGFPSYVVFDLSDGQRFTFTVAKSEIIDLVVGDVGELRYRGKTFSSFRVQASL